MYNTPSLLRLLGNVWYYALSNAYSKKVGAYTICHTDSLGALFLQHIPYDELHVDLDNIYKDIHPRFWAYAKIKAIEKEDVNFVHIDGDVFIKSKDCFDILFDRKYDVIVQNFESSSWYNKEFHVFDNIKDTCIKNKLNYKLEGAYNTGVLGFKNKQLKDNFVKGYINIAKDVSKNNKIILDKEWHCTPDLIIEQRYIYQLAKQYRAYTLFDDEHTVNEQAKFINYQHVITIEKFKHLDKVKALLKKHDKETYNKIYKLCQDV